jgi:hypothetical protein
VPALLWMEREGVVSPCIAELHALGGQHKQGGVQAWGAPVAHEGCPFAVGGGQRHGLAGGKGAVRR